MDTKVVLLLMTVCVPLVSTTFTQTSQSYSDLEKGSSVDSNANCKGDTTCENSFTEDDCENLKVCSLQCPSGSRTNFPGRELLTSTTECQDTGGFPTDAPTSVDTNNGHYSTNTSINPCTTNRTVSASSSGMFGVSFWIRGSCATECDILRLGTSLTVSLAGTTVKLSAVNIDSASTTDWIHIAFTKRSNGALEVFVNGTEKTGAFPTVSGDLQSVIAALGPSSAITDSDAYMVLDARFYSDGLTDREISSFFTGTFEDGFPLPECRCPISHPKLSDDGYTCGTNQKRLDKIFHSLQEAADDTNKNWASKAETSNTITLDLGNKFQVEEVRVTFNTNGSSPSRTTWKFDDRNVDALLYTLNPTNCKLTSPVTSPTRDNYEAMVAQTITMTLTARSAGTKLNYIIEQIVIVGRCHCDGTASECSKTSGSPSYTCTCLQNAAGQNCESCANGKFRKEEEFGCNAGCGCYYPGVNQSDICEAVGGRCKCKANVEGTECRSCKRLYYNLAESNPLGCTRSSCDEYGSESCNNQTGTCNCRPNVKGSNCDSCQDKFYDIRSGRGCFPCDCQVIGTVGGSDSCDVTSGQCTCKIHVTNRQCNECKDEYFALSAQNTNGCTACNCNMVGSDSSVCNKTDGMCPCRGGTFTTRTCDPEVNDVVPGFGPVRGGTVVTISGHYLDRNTQVLIQGTAQEVLNSSDPEFIVRMKAGQIGRHPLVLQWGNIANNSNKMFEYRPDPTIDTPGTSSTIKAARRGGCAIIVSGSNLNSIAVPKLTAIVNSTSTQETVCQHLGETGKRMICPTPKMSASVGTTGTLELSLDGTVQPLSDNVVITTDSVVHNMGQIDFKPPFEKKIKISGKNFGQDCRQDDYLVFIGETGYVCSFTSFSQTEIECEPPQDPPAAAPTAGGDRVYNITVKIGTQEITAGRIYYKHFWLTEYFVYIMVGVGLFVILLIVIAICCCCYRCRRRRGQEHMNGTLKKKNKDKHENNRLSAAPIIEHVEFDERNKMPGSGGVANRGFALEPTPALTPTPTPTQQPSGEDVVDAEFFLHRVEESIRSSVKDSILPKRNFETGCVCIAKGSFARLIDGAFTTSSQMNPRQKVTIKMLKDPLPGGAVLPAKYIISLRECLRFKPHKCEHVLRMQAIGLDKSRFYIIYPFMEKKTLKEHILNPDLNFVLRELLEFIVQVCEGMEYLADKGLVHKDIATRNCMIDAKDTVKIGDSAFSWDFYPDEYMYDEQKDRYMPVRWMALESLQHGFYDTKSDVWSFGVLMWEVLTRGILPFSELGNHDLQNYIDAGYRLGKPHQTSDELYELMNSCWQVDSELRPSFYHIMTNIGSSMDKRQSMNEDLYINTEVTDSVYINSDEVQRLRELSQSRRGRH